MSGRTKELEATIFISDEEEVFIEGYIEYGLPGRREFGAPIEPDDEPEYHITRVTNYDGEEIELTPDQEYLAYEALVEAY